MKIYEVYSNSAKNEVVLIKEGNNFIAGVFGPFWALYHKMWILSIITFGLLVIQEYLRRQYIFIANYDFILTITVFLLFYFYGNKIIAYKLSNSGYVLYDIIVSRSLEEGEYKYYKKVKNEESV